MQFCCDNYFFAIRGDIQILFGDEIFNLLKITIQQ